MKDQAQLKYAVCMGILVMLHPGGWIGECAATMLSYKGRAFTFDVGADGFIRGEGCCAVHLAAENDGERAAGERSLAVLLGSCANQDGRSASLTAPHGPSQQKPELHHSMYVLYSQISSIMVSLIQFVFQDISSYWRQGCASVPPSPKPG